MRILFTVHVGRSHLRQLIPLAQAAKSRGHTVAVASAEAMRSDTEHYGLDFLRAGLDWTEDPACVAALLPPLMAGDQEGYEQALIFECALGRPALVMAREVLALARDWQPDVIVRENEELGGYLAAEILGIPHVSVAGGSSHLVPTAKITEPVNRLRALMGLPPAPAGDPYKHLLGCWLPGRYYNGDLDTATLRHYCQEAPARDDDVIPAWIDELPADRPFVYFALGTVTPTLPWKSDDVVKSVLEALSEVDCTVVASIGLGKDVNSFGAFPEHIHLVNEWLPQHLLLERCDLFITHGGNSSIREGLRAGVPMLVTPICDDQPHAAANCEALGVARAVPVQSISAAAIGEAVRDLLGDPGYRDRAAQFKQEMVALPPADAFAEDVENLVAAYAPAAR